MVLRGSNPYSYRPKEVPAKQLKNGSEPNTGLVGIIRGFRLRDPVSHGVVSDDV
ncbi:hypothetical protein LguiB_031999 [Lonicera macranthoides]